MTDHPASPDLLPGLIDAAGRLGLGFSDAAQAATDPAAKTELARLFLDCFKAFRLGRLLLVRRPQLLAAPAEAPDRQPRERDDDRAPCRAPGHRDRDRDRDRDYEPVSLPTFLNALGVVARNAPAVSGQAARDLDLIRSAAAEARRPEVRTALAVLNRPKPKPDHLSRLLAGAAPLRPPKPNSS